MPRPRTPPAHAARRLLAAGFLDPALVASARGAAGGTLGGRFVLVHELGRGGHGVVWRARDLRSGREMALKLLTRSHGAAAERLLREGQLAASLEHPGIVRVHESGRIDDQPYLLYALVEGGRTLHQALPGLGWEARLACLRHVVDALAHAHARGVVHRDLKPSNVILDRDGQPRVTDFGVGWGGDLQTMTATGAAVGTPSYMAPEQITGDSGRRAPAVDVWALGVLLYQCGADRLPFEGSTLIETAQQILAGHRVPLRQAAPHVPPAVAAVCARALQVDPGERYPDAGAFGDALEHAVQQAPRPRRVWPFALAGGAALAAAAWAVTALPARQPPASPQIAASPQLSASPQPPASPQPTRSALASPPPSPSPGGSSPGPTSASPPTPAPVSIDGYLEAVDDRGWALGWAADPSHPLDPVTVEFVVTDLAGEVVHRQQSQTRIARGDVQRARGYPGKTYGFHDPLPERLRDGRAYTLTVLAGDPPTPLGKTPRSMRLPRPIQPPSPLELIEPDVRLADPVRLAANADPVWLDYPLVARRLSATHRLALRLDLQLTIAKGGAGRLIARLTARGPAGEVTLDHPVYTRGLAPDGRPLQQPAELYPLRWLRIERDLLPDLRAEARARGLTPAEVDALSVARLQLGWVAEAGLQVNARVADLSLAASE